VVDQDFAMPAGPIIKKRNFHTPVICPLLLQ